MMNDIYLEYILKKKKTGGQKAIIAVIIFAAIIVSLALHRKNSGFKKSVIQKRTQEHRSSIVWYNHLHPTLQEVAVPKVLSQKPWSKVLR